MATAVNATEEKPQSVPSVQDMLLSRIAESKSNPRRQFDETKLAELADNIRMHGVLQPVLVRPMPGAEPGFYELVAGARRYRASKLAKRETIPATVRELTDAQCLELQLIENLQRADVHELDEARGYAALMHLQPKTYTVETLAEKIGRSEKYVYARLRLTHLVDEAQQAFYAGKLTVAHAFEIARLTPDATKSAPWPNASHITAQQPLFSKTRRPKPSPCENSVRGLTHRTKRCFPLPEAACAARSEPGPTGFSSLKLWDRDNPFAPTASATAPR